MESGLRAGLGIGIALLASGALVVALILWAGLSVLLGLTLLAVLDVLVIGCGYWVVRRIYRESKP